MSQFRFQALRHPVTSACPASNKVQNDVWARTTPADSEVADVSIRRARGSVVHHPLFRSVLTDERRQWITLI